MNRLSNRLKRLERIRSVPGGDFDFNQLQQAALSELSAVDREIMEALIATGDFRNFIEAHSDVWNRWERVFSEAITKTRFPVKLLAADLLV
jgi:hypothetical protein